MTVIIAGASGFMGRRLRATLEAAGETVRTVGRTGDATWGDTAAIARLVDGADLVVNLAGKSVDCRYGPANRAEILRSRVDLSPMPPLWRAVAERVIHATADLEYAVDLVTTEDFLVQGWSALRAGAPGYAAVDVYEEEPPAPGHRNPLLDLPNALCTPHLGYVERDNYENYFGIAFDNINNFASGKPTNLV